MAFLLGKAKLAYASGDVQVAGDLLERATGITIDLLDKLPGDRIASDQLMQAVFQSWEMDGILPAEQIMTRLPAYDIDSQQPRACQDFNLAVKQALMLGDIPKAAVLTAALLDRGYTEMSFMQFCREHNLCKGR